MIMSGKKELFRASIEDFTQAINANPADLDAYLDAHVKRVNAHMRLVNILTDEINTAKKEEKAKARFILIKELQEARESCLAYSWALGSKALNNKELSERIQEIEKNIKLLTIRRQAPSEAVQEAQTVASETKQSLFYENLVNSDRYYKEASETIEQSIRENKPSDAEEKLFELNKNIGKILSEAKTFVEYSQQSKDSGFVRNQLISYLQKKYEISRDIKYLQQALDVFKQALANHNNYFLSLTTEKKEEQKKTVSDNLQTIQLEIASLDSQIKRAAAPSPQLETRKQILASEALVAKGIKQLYDSLIRREGEIKYDAQGIAIVFVQSQEEINRLFPGIEKNFPGGLQQGVMIHIHEKDFIQAPPIRYMMMVQADSLCTAAKELFQVKVNKELVDHMIREAFQEAIDQSGKYPEFLITRSKELMQKLLNDTRGVLYQQYLQQSNEEKKEEQAVPLSVEEFGEKLNKYASNHRPSYSIITIDKNAHTISYDSGASVSAHDRKAGQPGKRCANLSVVYEGHYSDDAQTFQISSSIVKHASLPPIKSIPRLGLSENNPDILVETYQNAKEVVEKMVMIRLHG